MCIRDRFNTADKLAKHTLQFWPVKSESKPYVVCTGGEPLLQIDHAFVSSFHNIGFEIAIETNGTILPPNGVDWVCVSPKIGSELVLTKGQELKLVYPQPGGDPKQFEDLDFDYFSLQPMDGVDREKNTNQTLSYCTSHPHWRVSLQTHKFLGIP